MTISIKKIYDKQIKEHFFFILENIKSFNAGLKLKKKITNINNNIPGIQIINGIFYLKNKQL